MRLKTGAATCPPSRCPTGESSDTRIVTAGLLIGAKPGRTASDELTVYESLGLAVEDLAAAEYVVRRAHEAGAGTTVEF